MEYFVLLVLKRSIHSFVRGCARADYEHSLVYTLNILKEMVKKEKKESHMKQHVVLITGASSGIGKDAASYL
jgi:hypothetical protein